MGLTLRAAGLYTFPSTLSEVPEGALKRANNVHIDRDGIITPKRGLVPDGTLTSGRIVHLARLVNDVYIHTSADRLARGLDAEGAIPEGAPYDVVVDAAGAPAVVATPDSAPGGHVSMSPANNEMYVAAKGGVLRVSGSEARPAGVPRPLSFTSEGAFIPGSLGSGFLAPGRWVAYRATLVTEDALGNEMESEPGDRLVMRNYLASAAHTTMVVRLPNGIPVPTGASTDYRIRLYRTKSAASAADTGDNMGLVYEWTIEAADITNRFVGLVDVAPDGYIGRALYTNDLQEGILQGNAAPPFARVLGTWRNHMLYANTQEPQGLALRVIGEAAAGNSITVGGQTFNVVSGALGATDLPQCDGSAASIEAFAQQLVEVINESATCAVYASYISGTYDMPGGLYFWSRDASQSSPAFTVSGTWAGPFDLDLPATSSAADRPGRVFISKPDRPWSVPRLNYRDIVDSTATILAIQSLRDTAFVFTNRGLYRSSGRDAFSLYFEMHDANAILVAPRSVQVLNGEIYAWTQQGVVRINEGGVEVISRPIEWDLAGLLARYTGTQKNAAFAVAQERDKRYTLFVREAAQESPADFATKAYVYNFVTQAWTARIDTASAGAAAYDGRLLLASGAEGAGYAIERRDLADTDYLPGPVTMDVEWVEQAEGAPGNEKQWTEAKLLLTRRFDGPLTFTFRADDAAVAEEVVVDIDNEQSVTTIVPRGCQRASRLSVGFRRDVTGEEFGVLGLELKARVYGDRSGK